ncbi:MAG: ankyrin repeat domain-containing protein [Pseudomonadales bacterium]|nr:ankyrin repeat domain-containing protein [Pseudomonadales bacterium]
MAERATCYSLPHVKAMRAITQAATTFAKDRNLAINHLTRAQAYQAKFPRVVADLALGVNGRKVLDLLLSDLLRMKEIEVTGSVLVHVLDSTSSTPLTFLLQHNADPNLLDSTGFSPLMRAVYWSKSDRVETLLEFGGDLSLRNKNGLNAKNIASKLNRKDLHHLFRNEAI